MIIDFQCARLTKKDKPFNWMQTIKRYYPHLHIYNLERILKKKKYYKLKNQIENCMR